jgi:hypothetical protein
MRKEWNKEKEGVILKFRDFKGFGFGYRFRALINSSFDGSNFGPKIMGYPFLLKIARKAPWISCRPFQLTKMFLVYDEKLGSEIKICMGSYNPKYVNVLRVFFVGNYVFQEIQAENVTFQKLASKLVFLVATIFS